MQQVYYTLTINLMHQRLSPESSLLVIIDVQERLLPAVQNQQQVVFNIRRLLEGARILSVPVIVSEQYPQGLGNTVKELAPYIPEGTAVLPKKSFSVYDDERLRTAIDTHQRSQIILCGVETHVCVLQSAFDLQRAGKEVYVVADAVASRFVDDMNMALRRFDSTGIVVTTTESLLFEWCRTAEHPQFKEVSRLAKESIDVCLLRSEPQS
ncbi:MAG: hydrolase [Planctomycetaceae bacterium]|jgi:nicotinamidase-related amidase|nr:hydrolase [Planctomycetaceae bacterium]